MTGEERAGYLHIVCWGDADETVRMAEGWNVIVDKRTGIAYSMFNNSRLTHPWQTIPRLEVAALIDAGELPR